ncbi:MAG: nucleotide pyrophosphatase/phosphodiesterase family protein [Planctomycetaceae bacterium]|nr:alkaline phosphatase family protein [Planctomycetaceae bacterium]
MSDKLLVIQVAALSEDVARQLPALPLTWAAMDSVLPAVTCTAQATFRTASLPAQHGMIANGIFHRTLRRAMFWEQSSALVSGRRIWENFSLAGKRTAMLFWQQSLGECIDVVLSPAPIHKHHGRMIQDCYSQPPSLYGRLKDKLGPFKLQDYWGPAASARAGDWIAAATIEVLQGAVGAIDLCMTYLPTLDYDLQRWGPSHERSAKAVELLGVQLRQLLAAAQRLGYRVLVFGDYAIAEVTVAAVHPNAALLAAGLMAARNVRGMLYPDLHTSRAFAVVDHEVAHVYVRFPDDITAAAETLGKLPGVAAVLQGPQLEAAGLNHPNSGELVLLAQEGAWFAYPWWTHPREAPDYATHVDIHNKPGFDPCELFLSLWPPGVSTDARKVRGTHGLIGPGRRVAWASTAELGKPSNLVELSQAVERYLK